MEEGEREVGLAERDIMKTKRELLAIIPARAGSTRLPNKNTRLFCGKPLIAYTIELAKKSPLITRVVVDTDSEETAALARTYGAEVPFLRPPELATSTSGINDAVLALLGRLNKDEGYAPERFVLLQPTSPLREEKDISGCVELMDKTDATTVLTITNALPQLYHLDEKSTLMLANKPFEGVAQNWPEGFIPTGAVYIVDTKAFLKEKKIYTENTKGVLMQKWRSVDIDYAGDFAAAELLYRHREEVLSRESTLV